MSFQPVILWTDGLIFLLLAAVLAFVWFIRRHEPLLAPWRRVAKRPMAMGSAVVLLVFVVIGLLDSLHYRPRLEGGAADKPQYAVEVLSVFDALLTDLRTQHEKTYSAPLATHLYAKEFVDRNGTQIREYPRLKFGGAHLANDSERRADIVQRSLIGAAYGVLLSIAAGLLFGWWQARRRHMCLSHWFAAAWRGQLDSPMRTVMGIASALLILGSITAQLAAGYHVFGTDKVGQDVLYITLKSIRTGLIFGTLATIATLPQAIILGIAAGYFRGWVDDVIVYIYSVLNSIPGVLLMAASTLYIVIYIESHPELFSTALERADIRLLALCIILGVMGWTGLARILRAETLKLRTLEYVEAARAFGVSHAKIISRHIFPNVFHLVLMSVVIDFSGLVLAEAVLSYIGVGVDPTTYSWGNMINGARLELAREPTVWWQLGAAFVFMFTLVLAANLFADGVRDAFDPRAGGRR